MSGAYAPLLILFGLSVVNAIGMVVASQILNPRRPTPQKEMPYESGMIPLGDTRTRFAVKFYMVAISLRSGQVCKRFRRLLCADDLRRAFRP